MHQNGSVSLKGIICYGKMNKMQHINGILSGGTKMKKTLGIFGIIALAAVNLMLILLIIFAVSTGADSSENDDGTLSAGEIMALTRRSSELYCAGIYYTDKALSASPEQISYDQWTSYIEKAGEYWDALDEATATLKAQIDDDTFKEMADVQKGQSASLFLTASALESSEIIRVFDSAQAGHRLKTLAEYLGKDMNYARQALKMANGQITSESWNDYADTYHNLEASARVVKTVVTGAAIAAAAPATSAIGAAAAVVSGACWVMQVTDDGCFVMMGNEYDSSEFVANLKTVTDSAAPVSGALGFFSMNFSKSKDAVLAAYSYAENLRALFQEGKILGLQLDGVKPTVTTMTQEELEQYKQAQRDGKTLPGEVESLLKTLQNIKNDMDKMAGNTGTETPSPSPKPSPEQSAVPEKDSPDGSDEQLLDGIVGTWIIVDGSLTQATQELFNELGVALVDSYNDYRFDEQGNVYSFSNGVAYLLEGAYCTFNGTTGTITFGNSGVDSKMTLLENGMLQLVDNLTGDVLILERVE